MGSRDGRGGRQLACRRRREEASSTPLASWLVERRIGIVETRLRLVRSWSSGGMDLRIGIADSRPSGAQQETAGLRQCHNPWSNRPERRTALVARELTHYKVDMVALSETRFSEQGQLEEVGADYTSFRSGRPGPRDETRMSPSPSGTTSWDDCPACRSESTIT
nr:unnamed protein product [Spirometra erinaceieuropaei]